tara:strand:+ start:14530 stop:14883 length:354 start_codon:yes stop_codon:yes gene_type:complete
MIVKDGKAKIAQDIVSSFTKIKIGNGGDATAESQHSLDSVITDNSGAEVTKTITPSVIGSQLVWTVSFLGSEIGTQGVSELGIFNSADTLLSRVTFTNTGVVPSADTVTFTIRLEVD